MHSYDEILNAIKTILVEEFECDEALITPDVNLFETLDLDSIDAVDLIVRLLNLKDGSPFTDRYSWRPLRRLDPELLNAAAQRLVGTHDFSSFVVERSKIDDAVRTIYRIEQQMWGNYCTLTFVGNGFLYKMIRCLMGTIEAAGAGKISPDAVTRILESKNRTNAPETAPPQGLFLMKVFYEEEELRNFKLTHLPFQ